MAGGNSIGNLFVTLGFDASAFFDGVKKVSGALGGIKLEKGLEKAFEGATDKVKELAGSTGLLGKSLGAIGPLGLAFAAALGVGYEALHKTTEAINEGAEFGKLSKAIGVSTDFIQKFNFAARQSDIDVKTADEALKGLNTSLGLVQSGLARSLTTKAFAAVGFSPEQLRQFHDVGDFFPVLVERIAKTGSAAEQAAIAKRLGISELLPMLREGAANFNKLAKEAEDLGVVMDSGLIAKAEEAKHKLSEIDDVMKAKSNVTFAEFADTLLSVKSAFADAEKAGLSFLAMLTHTESPDAIIARTQDSIAAVKKTSGGGALSASQQAALNALNVDLRAAQIRKGMAQLSAAPGEKPQPATQLAAGTSRHSGPTAAGDERAIAEATKAELAARMALTGDIAQLADLRVQEIEQERIAKNAGLDKEVGKSITAAAAKTAQALNNQAADEQKQAAIRQAGIDLANHALDQSSALNQTQEQINAITADLAATAAQRAAVESDTLARQQDDDRQRLVLQQEALLAEGKTTALEAEAALDAQARLQLAQKAQLAEKQRVDAVQEAAAREQGALSIQADLLASQASLQTSAYSRAVIEAQILAINQQIERSKAQEAVDVAKIGSVERAQAEAALAALPAQQAAQKKLAERQTRLIDAIDEAGKSAADLRNAFQSHDWKRVFDDFQQTIQTVQAAFKNQGTAGGLAALASAAGNAIGGKGGKALSDGANAFGTTLEVTGNPIIAAAAAAVVAIFDLAKSKPSNHGAIATFDGGSFSLSGNKRNADTTTLANTAANAVLDGMKLLSDAGISFATTVKSIDIGTRDPAHIQLSNGQILTAGVADAAGAAEAGLKAMLADATYASDTERQLVQSMLAAGKGFDAITKALGDYENAQKLGGVFADALLKITNPEAADLKDLKAAQDARRAAVQAAADQGLITADMLASLNAQLDTLDKAELDQVVQKYAASMSQAADQANQAAAKTVDEARSALQAAFQKVADSLTQTAQQFRDIAGSLKSLRAELTSGSLAGLDPIAQAAADRANLSNVQALAATGDQTALGQLPDAIRAFVTSNTAIATSKQGADAIVAEARDAAAQGEAQANAQASAADAQLAALQASVDGLITVNDSVLSVKDAVLGLGVALAAQQATIQAGIDAMAKAQALAAAQYQAATAAAQAAANSNTAAQAATAAQLSATAAAASTTPAGSVAVGSGNGMAQSVTQGVVDALWQPLATIARNTSQTASTLDDAANGAIPLKVVS